MKLKSTLCILSVSALLVVSAGCKKKAAPETPYDPPQQPPPAQSAARDVTPSPAPTTNDRTPPIADLQAMQADERARREGLIGDIYFDFDKYDLKQTARDQLAKNAAFLRENAVFTVTIEGHCDERGTNDYNIALGDRRSNAARDYLMSLGIDGGRIRTLSYGEERPVCTDSNESCWAKNRRGEFHITGRH